MVATQHHDGTGNLLLDGLVPGALEDLREDLEGVELRLRDRLVERGTPVDRVYFPVQGFISLVSVMEDGSTVETAVIGREGILGIPAMLDAGRKMGFDAITQIPGRGFVMDAGPFLERVGNAGSLHDLVGAYTAALFLTMGQNAACNRLHTMNERISRWLLTARDRVDDDEFPLTQEFLAQMLGVRRASVTEAAEQARASGAIRYQRGVVTIVDRSRLEASACECYGITRDALDGIYD